MEQVPKSALIVSRHRLIAEMLTDYLVTRSDIRAEWVPDLDAITQPQRFGVVVLDLDPMPTTNFPSLQSAKSLLPDSPVAVLTDAQDTELFLRLVAAGASGILQKQRPLKSLVATLMLMIAGEQYVPVGH
jgi:DNA-binding NarL/FixJ family response regulator